MQCRISILHYLMIRFFNEDVSFDLAKRESVAGWLTRVAVSENCRIASLAYIFCSDAHLLSINQQFLNHDYYTDIVTFDYRDQIAEHSAEPIEGDVFISIERVRENATALSIVFEDELLRVMVHGLLHLIGYDDTTSELKQSMRRLEDKYLHLYTSVYDQL